MRGGPDFKRKFVTFSLEIGRGLGENGLVLRVGGAFAGQGAKPGEALFTEINLCLRGGYAYGTETCEPDLRN